MTETDAGVRHLPRSHRWGWGPVAFLVLATACGGTSAPAASNASSTSSADSTEPTTVVPTTGAVSPPSSSPTSSALVPQPGIPDDLPWIVYEWEIPGNSDGAYIVRPDGSRQVRIFSNFTSDEELVHPDWTRDGQRLVFGRGPGGPTSTGPKSIWIADADGSNAQTLVTCDGTCLGVENPSWSPDGTKVVFTDHEATTTAIQVVDVATKVRTPVTPLSEPNNAYARARWSPDGTHLVIEMERYNGSDLTGARLAIVGLDGAAPKPITDWETFATFPDWHPTENLIVFSTFDLSAFQDTDKPSNLFTIRPDGTGLTQLTKFDAGAIRATQPTWTGDGKRIIFTHVTGAHDEIRNPGFISRDGTNLTIVPVNNGATHSRLRPRP